ncbi:MAG: hypothetical protein KatS3mg031_2447 [Chitinophagales bacterium]|nr:MAG: hypothetical protein KatS3mg031_2447 [Chitinophagales bacterium]
MKHTHILFLLSGILTFTFLTGCSASRQLGEGAKEPKEPLQSSGPPSLSVDKQAAQEAFIDGVKAKLFEDYDEAVRMFQKCLKFDPQSDGAYYELAVIYFRRGEYDQALKNIKEAVRLNPDNKWYLLLYAEVLSYKGLYMEAAAVYEKILKQNPTEVELYFDWAYMLIKANKPEEAIRIYDTYEQQVGLDENVIIQKERLYLRMGKLEKAAAEIRKLINAYPGEPRYYKMLADLYETNNQSEKAAKVYEELLQIDKNNPNALLYLAEMYRIKGDAATATEYLKKAFANPSLHIDVKVRILLPYLQQIMAGNTEKKEEAFTLAQLLIEAHPGEAKAHAIYGDLLYQDKQNEDALAQYLQALELDSSVYEVWQQIFFIYSDLKNYAELEKMTESAMELFPNQPAVYLFNGIAKNSLKKYAEAADVLTTGEAIVVNNPLLKAQMLSTLGEVYNNLGNYARSDSAYEKSLQLDPDNAYTLNNYSYYLSLRGEKLEEALKMSEKSNKLVPDNPSFEDTYAWILYKMGRYEEARQWMEKALHNGGDQNPVILEHYGDILFKLGQTDKAVAYWQKAKALGSDSELIGKKIADRKMYE